MTWREGYLLQAESDYSIYRRFNKSREPMSHQLHYLQMATEKLAKAFMSKADKPHPPTHIVFVTFLRIAKGNPKIYNLLDYPKNKKAFGPYIDGIIPIAEKVQNLVPVGGDMSKLNVEYPWLDGKGNLVTPICYEYPEFSNTDLNKLQTLLSNLFRIARSI